MSNTPANVRPIRPTPEAPPARAPVSFGTIALVIVAFGAYAWVKRRDEEKKAEAKLLEVEQGISRISEIREPAYPWPMRTH